MPSFFQGMMPAVLSNLDNLLHEDPDFKDGAAGYAATRAISRMKESKNLDMALYVVYMSTRRRVFKETKKKHTKKKQKNK